MQINSSIPLILVILGMNELIQISQKDSKMRQVKLLQTGSDP